MLFDGGARSTLLPLQASSEAPAAIMNQAAADSDIMLPQHDFELEDEVSFVNSRRGNPGPVARRDVSETPDWATHPVIFARIEFNNLPHLTIQGQRPGHFDFFLRTFNICSVDEDTTWIVPGESLTCSLRQIPQAEFNKVLQVWSVVDSVKFVLQTNELPEAARKFQALQIYSFVSSSLCGVLFIGFVF